MRVSAFMCNDCIFGNKRSVARMSQTEVQILGLGGRLCWRLALVSDSVPSILRAVQKGITAMRSPRSPRKPRRSQKPECAPR